MRYMQAYRYIFASPNWTMNVVFATLASFIPIAGQLVMMGYLFGVIEHFLKHGKKTGPEADHYPDFETARLMDYLKRGVAPFLAWFVFKVPLIIAIWLMWIIGTVIAAAIGSVVVSLLMNLVLFALTLALVVAANTVMVPAYLRAGLTQSFSSAFSVPGIKDFLTRMGKDAAMAQLFLIGTAMVLTIIGAIAFCVGAYIANALVFMAAHHLDYQLYELYLERGGAPIEVKEPSPA